MKNIDSLNDNHPPRVHVESRIVSPYAKQPQPKRRARRILKFIGTILLLGIVGAGIFAISRAVQLSNRIFVGQKTTIFQKFKDVFRGNNGNLKLVGEDLGQINILLLGIGGEGHDGPYLSDTIILAQIRPDTGEIVMTSIPRDYYVQLPTGGKAKINAAFAEGFARNKDWNEAGRWAREVVEKTSGLTIPYFAVVDFAGFEKAVNEVGGLDIYVERTFTDYQYPNEKLGYLPALTFKQGWERMDGTRALQFARSRHAAFPEGSDFARSQRQQKVISAFKEKVLKLNLVADSGKINQLLSVFANHFHTNMSPGEIFRIYKLTQEKGVQNILSVSLDPETNLICDFNSPETGYILIPCEGKTAKDIEDFFKNSFAAGKLGAEQSVIWLGTSTEDKAAYKKADTTLKSAGMTVWEVGYGGEPIQQTVYYQVNPKPATAEYIKNTLGAREVIIPPPGIKVDKNRADIIVILGESN